MKTIQENVKNAFKQSTTQRKGRILVNGEYYDVYNVEYYADCYDEGKVIGNAIASQLDFDIPYMPKFDTFQYFDAIMVNNNYEYIDFGTFTVFDEKDQDEFNKHITAFDNLIKFNKPFENAGSYPKTLYSELLNVCQQAGVNLANLSIPNGDFIVESNQFVSGESLKTVLKQICAISGNYGIVKNNVLHLQLKNTTNEVINKSQHEPIEWKRRSYGINQVIIGDSQIEGEYVIREDSADIALNGVHKLEILDNLFAYTQEKRNALIDNLFNQVKGFGYIPFEAKGEWLSYLEIGDTLNIDGIDTILLRVNAKSPKSLETTISAPAIIDSSIKYVDNTADVNNKLKLTERTVDKQNQVITDVVSNVNEQNNKISQITQTVDELNAKIQDIADITISGESNFATFTLENINESEPIQIKVKPINDNISYLYPNSELYPSNNLYPKVRIIRFHNNTTNQNVDYVLPDNLLIYDSTHYDEFYLDYDSQTCQITKRCKYNSDGSVSLLDTERVDNYPYPSILLEDGDYTLTLLGYEYGYLFVRLMAKNIYTSQFYTKTETDSHINAKATEIELGVNQTLTNYSTTDQMNSAINVKANEITSTVSQTYATKETTNQMSSQITQNANNINLKVSKNQVISEINQSSESVTIKADKISLAGKTINMTSDNIAINSTNFKVDKNGNIIANNATLNSGTFKGNINTSTDCKIGNNLYVGQNPSSTTYDLKKIIFTDNVQIQRAYIFNNELLGLVAPQTRVYGVFGVVQEIGNTQWSLLGLSNTGFNIYCDNQNTYIRGQSGEIYMSHQPTYISDKRLKKDIKNIDVSWIDELKVKEFEYKNNPDKKQIGLIAQDYLDKDYSKYFLNKNNDDYYGIAYGNITNALIKYCQETKQEVESLKKEIEILKQEIKSIKESE